MHGKITSGAAMSDLQCPAMVILASPESLSGAGVVERLLSGRTLAGVFFVAPPGDDAAARLAAEELGAAAECRHEVLTGAVDAATLREGIDALSDLYRGEELAVVAPTSLIREVLRRADVSSEPIFVAVDDDGWDVRNPPLA